MRLSVCVLGSRWLCLALLTSSVALASAPLKNWFNDPFFQVRHRMAGCPQPLGPYGTEDEMKQQAHSRVERGTSCWRAGKCKKPNAYLYDADIANDLRRRFAASRRFADASLWITVQRRFVYVEGCVRSKRTMSGIEDFVKRTPDVELVIANTIVGTGKPNYAVMPARTPG
ncbi:BON domain-containing protein [Paludibacterium purpuratum]|uniref:BON domain-containing protein n=1 Tax=Paludibacterium purpuratum TaxID=1144873 RepID=A0A4R7B0L2_9NEIS|nr:BON domain-containing protein [Paludibacterium purpuratum]TDR76456.1 BON domain-containing protein [Paludibacterium purpuratum]